MSTSNHASKHVGSSVLSGTRGVSASVTGGFCNGDNELLTQTIGHLFNRLLFFNHTSEPLSIIYMLHGGVWWGKQDSTYQVNEVTQVLLDLLRRQTPHQVQSTVELLFSLWQTQITTQLCCQTLLVLVILNQTQLWRARNPHPNRMSMALLKEIKNNSSNRLYFELWPVISSDSHASHLSQGLYPVKMRQIHYPRTTWML